MHAGLARFERWMIGAALAAAVVMAHAQRSSMPFEFAGFPQPVMSRAIYFGGAGFLGLRASNAGGESARGYGMRVGEIGRVVRPFDRYDAAPLHGAGPLPRPHGDTWYSGGITPVSTEARQVPHPPADSPVRAGSIREDVARYNEERAAFRPYTRGGGDSGRPPMPSPYRN